MSLKRKLFTHTHTPRRHFDEKHTHIQCLSFDGILPRIKKRVMLFACYFVSVFVRDVHTIYAHIRRRGSQRLVDRNQSAKFFRGYIHIYSVWICVHQKLDSLVELNSSVFQWQFKRSMSRKFQKINKRYYFWFKQNLIHFKIRLTYIPFFND